METVAEPGAVVDAISHGFAEFAIAGHIDAELPLTVHDLRHRVSQSLLKGLLVSRLPRFAGAVRRDQIIWTRQASDMAGENMIGAGLHDSPSLQPAHPRSSVQAGLEAGFSLTQRNSFQ